MILMLLQSSIPEVVVAALHAISAIICSEKMRQSWSNFLELILLKVIDSYKAKTVQLTTSDHRFTENGRKINS